MEPPTNEAEPEVRASAQKLIANAPFATPIAPRPATTPGRTLAFGSVDNNGQPHFSIPLTLPPGVRDLAPQLSLEYDPSATSGGQIGAGWAIGGLSAVTRCPRTWAQDGESRDVVGDGSDRLCLDGQRLQVESGSYGGANASYRTEIDNYTRVTSFASAGTNFGFFRASTKSGSLLQYGEGASARVPFPGKAEPRLWPLNRIADRNGNAIDFAYSVDAANGSYRPDTIAYGPYVIKFSYEQRPNNEVDASYVAGSLIRDILRLRKISVLYGSTHVRSYALDYEPVLSVAGNSRLTAVTECAGANVACLEPIRFGYQNGIPTVDESIPLGSVPTLPLLVDFNGDGRDDLFYTSSDRPGGSWRYRLAARTGGFEPERAVDLPNDNYAFAIPIDDLNDDGRHDVLVPINQSWKAMLSGPQGLSGITDTYLAFEPGEIARAFDVNGDGLEDFVWQHPIPGGGTAIRYRLRIAGAGFDPAVRVLFSVPEEFAIESAFYAGGRLSRRVPDFNGDGRGDLLLMRFRINDFGFVYTLSALMTDGRTIEIDDFNPNIIYDHGDWNGDGKTDVVYFDTENRILVRFSDGVSFSQPFLIGDSSPYLGFARTLVTDWNGDGSDDLLLANRVTGAFDIARSNGDNLTPPTNTGVPCPFGQPTLGDINGDGLADLIEDLTLGSAGYRLHYPPTPDLLTSVRDNHGNVTTFEYTTTVDGPVYTRGSEAIFPEQDFAGGMRVVSRMRLPDGAGGLYNIRYSYSGARTHRQGRGFEGFATVTSVDERNGQRVVEYFHQSFPYTGLSFLRNTYQADGTLTEREQTGWSTHGYGSGLDQRYAPYVRSTRSDRFELGGSQNGKLLTSETVDQVVDATSGTPVDVTRAIVEGTLANGIQPGARYVERSEVPAGQLVNDAGGNWCLGRPNLVRTTGSHSQFGGAAQTRSVERAWNPASCSTPRVVSAPDHPTLRLVVQQLTVDGFGNVTAESKSAPSVPGRRQDVTWSADGRFPISVTDAAQQKSLLAWDPVTGNPLQVTDPNGLITRYAFDELGRLTRTTRPDGTATSIRYEYCSVYGCVDGNNRMVAIKQELDSNGAPVSEQLFYTDRLDRITATKTRTLTGAYNRSDTRYDVFNRIAAMSVPCWADSCTQRWVSFGYDALDRIVSVSQPAGELVSTPLVTRVFYEGLTTRFVDPNGKQTVQITGANDKLLRSVDADGYYQQFDYDAFDQPVRVTDSLGNTLQTLRYNEVGLKVEQTDLDAGRYLYVPNAYGELDSLTNPKGQKVQFVYDTLGRVQSRIEPEGNTLFTYGTSAADRNIGKLVRVGRNNNSLVFSSFTYDAFGRLASRTVSTRSDVAVATYGYGYDTAGQVDTLRYPFELTLKYGYASGKLQQIANANNPAEVFWRADGVDAAEHIIDETAGDGVRTERRFDQATGDLLWSRASSAGTPLREQHYAWDGIGNLVERSDTMRGLTETFGYDNLYRLKRSALNGVTNLELSYDLLGNIASKSDVGSYGYDPARKHAVVSAGGKTYGYDADGNVIARGGKAITWNSFDKPTRINGAGSDAVTFEYDAEQNLHTIQNRPNGSTTRGEMTNRVGDLVERYFDGTRTRYRSYIFGPTGAIAVQVRSTLNNGVQLATHYLQRDHLNSVDEIDAQSGQPLVGTSYAPFGQPRNASTWSGAQSSSDAAAARRVTDAGFTGHARVDLVNVVHMGGRVYDPLLGRFLSADPNIDGIDDTQGWNRYSYVINNPLRYTDPTGYGLFGLNFRFSFGGFFRGLAGFVFGSRRGGRGCRGSLCFLRNQTPTTGPTTPEQPRPAPTPPPRPTTVPPNQGPLGPRPGDPPIVRAAAPVRSVDDFIDVTDQGTRLNRERYNAYLFKILNDSALPTSSAKRQRQLYEALIDFRDGLPKLSDKEFADLFMIKSRGKDYLSQIRLEVETSLQRLIELIAGPAAVSGGIDSIPLPGKLGKLKDLFDILSGVTTPGFEIECGNVLTNPRFECIVRQSQTKAK